MSELRLNRIAREWVIIATDRAKRPEDFALWRERKYHPEYSEQCPFCPGNEGKTPQELLRVGSSGQWQVRVIPNKMAHLSEDLELHHNAKGLKHSVTGTGRHEIIIESPSHNASIPLFSAGNVCEIIRAYKERFVEVHRDPRVEHVMIFKNHGETSGTSIEHPHSQIVGTPVTPMQVKERINEANLYFETTGQCLMCDTIAEELSDKNRIVLETEHFLTFIPYAAFSAFHTWIFPKRHMASFEETTDAELCDLAFSLKNTLSRLYHGLNNPDYNYMIRSEVPGRHSRFHWYLSIVPRLAQTAGFSLGSGMYVNPSIPEEVAAFMREVRMPKEDEE